MIARISTFDALSLAPGAVRRAHYFEEAHRCELHGFQIAAAVLCRAVLEDALKEVIDPKGIIQGKARRDRTSYILAMLKEAGRLHLDSERVSAAKEIKEAGDKAIHDP